MTGHKPDSRPYDRPDKQPERFECHIEVPDGADGADAAGTAPALLAQHCELSLGAIKRAMHNGALWLESANGHVQRLRRAKKALQPGQTLHFYYDAAIQQQRPPEAGLIADEQHYSVWHKPAGMLSQGSRWGDHCSLYRYAETRLQPQRPAFIVHRLDRAASGLMLLAHSKAMARAFSDMFRQRQIRKHYRARITQDPGKLTLPHEIRLPVDGREAISRILAVRRETDTWELTVEIETGRKHQIRRHLAASGWPIIGDRLYGAHTPDRQMPDRQSPGMPDLQLQSVYLAFRCPVTQQEKVFKLDDKNNV